VTLPATLLLLPPASAAPTLVGILAVLFVCAGIWWLSSIMLRWGQDHPVPGGPPVWLEMDAVAITVALREQLHAQLPPALPQLSYAQDVVNELAQHHAHDMAERDFCREVDPEGTGLNTHLLRRHPTFIGRLSQWQSQVDVQVGWDPPRIAAELFELLNPKDDGRDFLERTGGNCLGIAAAVSEHRAVCCVVVASSWARLQRASQREAEPNTWVVGGQLTQGIQADSLAFTLQLPSGEELEVKGPIPTTEDDWEEGRFRLLLPLVEDLSEARLLAERAGDRSHPTSLP